jgi:hypothetical protein
VADWTCEAPSVLPDDSMDFFQKNGVLKVEFSLQLTKPGMRFLEIILLESPMSFSPSETANSKLAH